MRVYLDANAIIYSVEGLQAFQAGVAAWVGKVESAAGLLRVVTLRADRAE